MAPEQEENPHKAVQESDVYALGITWYEILTGKLPTPKQVIAKRYDKPCEDKSINDLIGRMVEYDVHQRPSLLELKSIICHNCSRESAALDG